MTTTPEINNSAHSASQDDLPGIDGELAALRAEIAALRAGEDDTPVEAGAFATPEQVLYLVNRLTRAERQQWINHVAAAQQAEHRCFVMDHVGKIEGLKVDRDRLQEQVRELSLRPTQWAYEAACEALEKRRVALVEALGLPSGEGFYEAVKAAAALRSGPAVVDSEHPYEQSEACGACGQPRSAHRSARLTVSWAPSAIRAAVDQAVVVREQLDDGGSIRVGTARLSWSDFACLIDVGRAVLADAEPAPETASRDGVDKPATNDTAAAAEPRDSERNTR